MSRRFVESRVGLTVIAIGGALLMLSAAMVALSARDQAIVAVITISVFLVANRFRSRHMTLFLTMLSILVSMRYIVWRLTETLDFTSVPQAFLGIILGIAEAYAIAMLLLGYFQTAWPLRRRPYPLPADPAEWPTVDVYVPTYNEDLDIVRATVLAAMEMDWPPEKLNVYILDDGRRVAFRDFAEDAGCGYIIRPDNFHAKAGNLNHAMKQTDGDFIVVFDCDHVPTRAFLQLTLGWMIADGKLALLQTPHHFYSPDPFQRNLASGYRVPAEGNMFYGLVQDGNDFWDATFFCGSCAVIRREALKTTGGFATETVTEDAHTALKLQRQGWSTAYLRMPLAAGLATERLILHIGQRIRWARGMLQIMRIDNPLLGRGLTLPQRLCYLSAMMHFLFAIPRVIFLGAPLAFLLLDQNIIAASPLAITAYAFPHIFHSVATGSRLQQNWRHSFWSEIYETVLALFLVRVTIVTLLSPRRGKFNVTDKGGVLENSYFDLRAVYPNLILGVLLAAGLLRGLIGMIFFHPEPLEFQALLLNSIWVSFSLLTVLAALAVGRETRQWRKRARVPARLPVTLATEDGRLFAATTHDISLSGSRVQLDWSEPLAEPVAISAIFTLDGRSTMLPGAILRAEGGQAILQWRPVTIEDEAAIVRAVFGRADAWLDWDRFPQDRALRGLWEVLRSIGGLFSIRRDTRMPPAASVPVETPRTAPAAAAIAPLVAAKPVPNDRLDRQTLLVKPRRVSGAFTVTIALIAAGGLAVCARAAPPPASAPNASVAAGVEPFVNPLPSSAASPAPSPASGPAPNPTPSGTAQPGSAPAPAPDAPAEGTTTRYTLAQLGANGPMTMRGTTPLQGLQFGVPANQLVTSAVLELSGALSPSLLPQASAVTVTLNEQYVGTIHVDPDHPTFGPLVFKINPVFLGGDNRLNFRFAGQYTQQCNDPLSDLLWATVSDRSTLTMVTVPLPPARELSRLPLPFFDPHVRLPSVVPMVLPADVSNDELRGAAAVASWFGKLTDYRGVSFPVSNDLPASGDAIVVALDARLPQGMVPNDITGPTLREIANPNDPNGTLLLVTGRSGDEIISAARALVLGSDALNANASETVAAPDVDPRRPYDAPAFIATDRKVRFGELVPASSLEGEGYVPGTMAVPFRSAPDLYTWRSRPFNLDVHIRAPRTPVIDAQASRLDVGINNMYLRTYSFVPQQTPAQWLASLVRMPLTSTRRSTSLPPWMVFSQNQLQFFFDARPLHRGACVAIPGDIHTAVDSDSTIDMRRAYHFTTLPNLAFFAGGGYPYTRMADLSQTDVVLPDRPGTATLTSFLDLMGVFGAETLYPATNISILRPKDLDSAPDADLLVLGTVGELGAAVDGVLSRSPYRFNDGALHFVSRGVLASIYYLFADNAAARKRQPPASLRTTLDAGGALVAAESPYRSHRSVVAFLASTPQGIGELVHALHSKTLQPMIQGDLVLLHDYRIASYRGGSTYTVGSLPFWLWPDWFLRERPIGTLVLAMIGCVFMAVVAFMLLRARSERRTREVRGQRSQLP